MNTREMFLAGPRPKVERVELGDFGSVYLRAMNAGELRRFVEFHDGNPSLDEALAMSAIVGVCDEGGSLLLSEADADAVKALAVDYLKQIQTAVLHLNNLDADADADEKKV